MPQYVICADGACSGNPGPGGWAYEIWNEVPAEGNEIASGSGSSTETTNNIMELRAALCSIQDIIERGLQPGLVLLRFDSEYVLKGIFEWLSGWKAKGWKTASKKPVKNAEIWKDIDTLIERAKAEGWTFEADWVKGHTGDFSNERVDTLACVRRDEAKEEVASGGRSEEACIEDVRVEVSPILHPVQDTEITGEQVAVLRDLLNPYLEGDVTIKGVLRALRENADKLGLR
jgi:ribonuclease HI